MTSTRHIIWFRQDLRLHDNPALTHAVNSGDILPIYIFDNVNADKWQMGAASKWWLHHSLLKLNDNLNQRLMCFIGDPKDILLSLAKQYQCESISWNRCYEPWQIQRDTNLKKHLKNNNINTFSDNGSLLWEPWQVSKADGTPYKVFTPFYQKGCLTQSSPRFPLPPPEKIQYVPAPVAPENSVDTLKLLSKVGWQNKFNDFWQPQNELSTHISEFITQRLDKYDVARDFPSEVGTSRLSAALHFGDLSPNQLWYAALNESHRNANQNGLKCFLSELGWREFAYYLLYHFPHLPEKNYNGKFDQYPWSMDNEKLIAWQRGQTGIPIIDAGMRELWQTGYMHNRVRMVVASFLTKNLGIPWQAGADWFWDCLLDADLASNSASWQWVAGTGADAAPYFRIFNPVTQGEKFDQKGDYVRHFCPELSGLPDKFIHKPWEASEHIMSDAAIQLGITYPKPIVDLKLSRQQALDHYKQMNANTTS